MSIEALVTVTLASVEVSDEYQVTLKTRRKLTTLAPDDAVQLAGELIDAAKHAEAVMRADFPVGRAQSHMVDVAPICRDCEEGKHLACIGSAFVERGPDVDEVPCGCSKVGHHVLGKSS